MIIQEQAELSHSTGEPDPRKCRIVRPTEQDSATNAQALQRDVVSFVSENCRRVGWRTENVGADARNRTWISPYITLRHPGRLALFCFPYTQLHPSTLSHTTAPSFTMTPIPARYAYRQEYPTKPSQSSSNPSAPPQTSTSLSPPTRFTMATTYTLVKDTTCTRSWTATTSLPPPSSRPTQFPRCKR